MSELIVITGASAGIGRALACNLADREKNVLAIGRNEIALRELQASNPRWIDIVSADIATIEGREKICAQLDGIERISALVNNAALMSPSGFLEDLDIDAWRYQMAVNVEAPLFLTTSLLPKLHGGRVMNLTIYSSFSVTVGLGAYGMSKAALNMMTQYFQHEFKKYQVSVTNVLPGIVDTAIQKQLPTHADIVLKHKTDNLRTNGELLSAQDVAPFLSWLLIDSTDTEYSSKTWDIKKDWPIELR